jgi:hypothetical protein
MRDAIRVIGRARMQQNSYKFLECRESGASRRAAQEKTPALSGWDASGRGFPRRKGRGGKDDEFGSIVVLVSSTVERFGWIAPSGVWRNESGRRCRLVGLCGNPRGSEAVPALAVQASFGKPCYWLQAPEARRARAVWPVLLRGARTGIPGRIRPGIGGGEDWGAPIDGGASTGLGLASGQALRTEVVAAEARNLRWNRRRYRRRRRATGRVGRGVGRGIVRRRIRIDRSLSGASLRLARAVHHHDPHDARPV